METLLVPTLTALISIIGGVVAGGFTGRQESRRERDRWLRETSSAFAAELRSTVKELTTKLAAAAHSMVWLCWLAEHGPERLTRERIELYDQEMHVLLPEIIGLHAVVAGMDTGVYLALYSLVQKVFEVDGKIGLAGLEVVPGEPASARSLSELYEDAAALEFRLSETVSRAIQPYAVPTKLQETDELP
jgi:hypothetical protein